MTTLTMVLSLLGGWGFFSHTENSAIVTEDINGI
jgi:hypothetical protein